MRYESRRWSCCEDATKFEPQDRKYLSQWSRRAGEVTKMCWRREKMEENAFNSIIIIVDCNNCKRRLFPQRRRLSVCDISRENARGNNGNCVERMKNLPITWLMTRSVDCLLCPSPLSPSVLIIGAYLNYYYLGHLLVPIFVPRSASVSPLSLVDSSLIHYPSQSTDGIQLSSGSTLLVVVG